MSRTNVLLRVDGRRAEYGTFHHYAALSCTCFGPSLSIFDIKGGGKRSSATTRIQARLLAAEHSAAFQILYLRCPPGTAMRLNAARAPLARVPPDAIRRMCQVWQRHLHLASGC